MRKSDFTLPTLDDLFSTQAERDDAKLERVRDIPLAELHPFKGHPFRVQNNEEMQRMIESIRKVGAITPALARPLPDGGYELISGHRRLAACQVLGVETMQTHPTGRLPLRSSRRSTRTLSSQWMAGKTILTMSQTVPA